MDTVKRVADARTACGAFFASGEVDAPEIVLSGALVLRALQDDESWETAVRLYALLVSLPEGAPAPSLDVAARVLGTSTGDLWDAVTVLVDCDMLSERDVVSFHEKAEREARGPLSPP